MVVKPICFENSSRYWFESSVISYGSKTFKMAGYYLSWFESSVISYGSKTQLLLCHQS